ncbi:MAG: glucose 1-dehydrogenase [Acidobacteria bacterium]|nr:glucose 1-dehydrogenase [Acidobacteriota bacterium]
MKAIAVTPGTKKLTLLETAEPKLRTATDVKIRMLDVGICGTDREICAFEYGTPPRGDQNLVIGHESLGRVIELGPGATKLKVGDLVVPMVRRPCPHDTCVACRSGRQDFCYTGDFTERGIKEAHGFMTEVVVDDQDYMNPVPASLRDVAVLVEPLTIAEKALMQLEQVQMRMPWAQGVSLRGSMRWKKSAVILGAGPVGLLGAMAFANAGFDTYVYSRSGGNADKPRIVESFGAKYVPAETTSFEKLREIVGNIDLVYEAVGASKTAFDLLGVLGTNGVFVFTGVPGRKAPVEVDTDLLMRNLVLKNQVVFGTVNAGKETFAAAIKDLGAFVERWPGAVKSLVTGRFPIEAHRDLLLARPTGIKNVLAFAS